MGPTWPASNSGIAQHAKQKRCGLRESRQGRAWAVRLLVLCSMKAQTIANIRHRVVQSNTSRHLRDFVARNYPEHKADIPQPPDTASTVLVTQERNTQRLSCAMTRRKWRAAQSGCPALAFEGTRASQRADPPSTSCRCRYCPTGQTDCPLAAASHFLS
eukprot:735293-Rhodomonas_salina.2